MHIWRRDDSSLAVGRFRGILVAVGGNELDEPVIRLACTLVKGTKTPLYAVHVIEMPWTEAGSSSSSSRRYGGRRSLRSGRRSYTRWA